MTESERRSGLGEASVCSSTECAPSGDGFTWNSDQRPHGRATGHPRRERRCSSGINSNKPYAEAQQSNRSNLPVDWIEPESLGRYKRR